MSLSKLSAKCQVCPFVDDCENKEIEAVGFLPIPASGLDNPDVDIKVGIDLATGPDFSAEQIIFPELSKEVLERIAEQFAISGYGTFRRTV